MVTWDGDGAWAGWTALRVSKARVVYFQQDGRSTRILEADGEGERRIKEGATADDVSLFLTGILIGRQEGEALGRHMLARDLRQLLGAAANE
mgnify:CR=1 FL=1